MDFAVDNAEDCIRSAVAQSSALTKAVAALRIRFFELNRVGQPLPMGIQSSAADLTVPDSWGIKIPGPFRLIGTARSVSMVTSRPRPHTGHTVASGPLSAVAVDSEEGPAAT